MDIRILSALLFLYVHAIFAAPMPIVYPFLSIIPEKNTVNVINSRTVTMKYTIVNNLSYRVNNITIVPDIGAASDLVSISYKQNTCLGVLNERGTCSFTLVLQGRNQTGSLAVTPRLCFFMGNNCSVPIPENVLHVSAKVLRSIDVTPEKSIVTIAKTQSFSAVADYSDDTKEDVTHDVIWHSSNNAIASIDQKTGIITGVAVGNANITATSDNTTSNVATLSVTKNTRQGP